MKAIVTGGGVAGSACAIALARIGADVTVYEAYEDPAGPVGSYVSLAVNGLRVLDTFGCLAAVQQAGFPVARHRMWSGGGKLLGDVARNRRPQDALLSVTLLRADLVSVLREEAQRSGATIVTGERVDPRALAADLVVGADGIWSATRRTLDPAAPEPAYSGLCMISGVSSQTPPGLPADGFNWVFARKGVFIFLPAPDGTVWWTAQIASAEPPANPTAIGVPELLKLFRTEPQATAVLRAATGVRSANLGHILRPVSRRHDERTVLIGDASHPVGAGQGASIAMEDALVLARHLRAEASVPAALEAFDRERQPRAGKLARMESRNRDAKVSGPVAARMREIVMPHMFGRVFEKATGWLYDFDPAAAGCQPAGTGTTGR
jgi:2-polyprenyl-6-methoxyphenol hydroxylase-like FAD-dependent oxidoreductase